jgi:hypothetical protein
MGFTQLRVFLLCGESRAHTVQIAGEETLNVIIITLSVKIDDEGDFFQV